MIVFYENNKELSSIIINILILFIINLFKRLFNWFNKKDYIYKSSTKSQYIYIAYYVATIINVLVTVTIFVKITDKIISFVSLNNNIINENKYVLACNIVSILIVFFGNQYIIKILKLKRNLGNWWNKLEFYIIYQVPSLISAIGLLLLYSDKPNKYQIYDYSSLLQFSIFAYGCYKSMKNKKYPFYHKIIIKLKNGRKVICEYLDFEVKEDKVIVRSKRTKKEVSVKSNQTTITYPRLKSSKMKNITRTEYLTKEQLVKERHYNVSEIEYIDYIIDQNIDEKYKKYLKSYLGYGRNHII